jgi:hypothetical protein
VQSRNITSLEFYLEEIGDAPQAVFTGVGQPLNLLLVRFLNPAPYFVPDILYEVSLVERRIVESSGFESEYVDVQVFHDRVEIKARPNALAGGAAEEFTLPLTEAKLLLMEWGAALERWRSGRT